MRRVWLKSIALLLLMPVCCLSLALSLAFGDEPAKKTDEPAAGAGAARMLAVTQSKGFKHGSVTRKGTDLSPSERALTEMGISSGLFHVDCTQDVEKDFTKEKLANYDIVFFYTTGDLPISQEAKDYFFNTWLKQKGHGFIGAHSATDTYHNYKPYWDMIGGTFDGHPWGDGSKVTITVHDPSFPAMKPWGSEFEIADEIYKFKNWQPEKVHVLMSMNMAKTQHHEPYHVPIAWCKNYGEGKVFYISLGHNEKIWINPQYRECLMGAIKWILNKEPGDATPNPEVSKAQEEKARADVSAYNKK